MIAIGEKSGENCVFSPSMTTQKAPQVESTSEYITSRIVVLTS